jgi:hypothetical protein
MLFFVGLTYNCSDNALIEDEVLQNETIQTSRSSEEETDEDLVDFIYNIQFENELSQGFEASKSLLYIESALQWTLVNPEEIPGDTQKFTYEFEATLEPTEEGWFMPKEELQTLTHQMYQQLYSDAETTEIEGVEAGEKFWLDIDVEIPEEPSYSEVITVQVTAVLAGKSKTPNSKSFTSNWYGYHRGYCNSGGSQFVTSVINAQLNGHVQPCGPRYLQTNIKIAWAKRYQNSSYTWLWIGFTANSCVSAAFLNNTSIPGMLNFANINRPIYPSGLTGKIKSYTTSRFTVWGNYQHDLLVRYYEKCVRIPPIDPGDGALHRPMKMF